MIKKNYVSLISGIMTVLLILACAVLAFAGYRAGIFDSVDSLRAFIGSAGLWGPVIFMIIQALQVVIPMLPGFVTCIAGALIFGPVAGFIYSYIGVCIGSIAAFYLARRYGTTLVQKLIKEETYNKYIRWLEKGKKFVTIILLGKPFVIALYSIGTARFSQILDFL